jgi:uncharacterized membrane protein
MDSTARSTVSSLGRATFETISQAAGQQNVARNERWISAVAGGGLIVAGVLRGKFSGLLMALGGGALVYRGLTGHCMVYRSLGVNTAEPRRPATSVPSKAGYKVEKTLVIRRPPEDLYQFWRDPENLPTIMDHLVSVKRIDGNRSHWVARGPMGATVEWDAEIHNERANELIAWRSLPGAEVDTAGSVHFEREPDGGTRLRVSLKYNPPAGKAGAMISSLLGADVEEQLEHDLGKLKQIMESGR